MHFTKVADVILKAGYCRSQQRSEQLLYFFFFLSTNVSDNRDKAPGQRECDYSIDNINKCIRDIEQASLAAVGQTLPCRDDISMEVSSSVGALNGIRGLSAVTYDTIVSDPPGAAGTAHVLRSRDRAPDRPRVHGGPGRGGAARTQGAATAACLLGPPAGFTV